LKLLLKYPIFRLAY